MNHRNKPTSTPHPVRRPVKGQYIVGLSLLLLTTGGCSLVKGMVGSESPKTTDNRDSSAARNDGASSSASSDRSTRSAPKTSGSTASSTPPKKPKRKLSPKQLHKQFRKWVKETDAKVAAGDEPVPASSLAELAQYKQSLGEAGLDAAAVYAEHLTSYYQLENGWRSPSSATVVAKQLNAEVASEGTLAAKEETTLSATKHHCYYLMSHTEEGRFGRLTFHSKTGDSPLLRFHVAQRKRIEGSAVRPIAKKSAMTGFCAADDVTVQVSAKLKDDHGSLRYIFLKTTRPNFSPYIASLIQVHVPDDCDAANWEQLWLQPIPGSIVFTKKRPYLVSRVDGVGDTWSIGLSAAARESRISTSDMIVNPSEASFSNNPRFSSCSRHKSPHHSALTQRVASCYESLNKRYAPRFEAANKAKRQARTYSARIAARGRLNQLSDNKKNEAKTCERIEAQAHKKMAESYKRIAERYRADRSLQFDRATILRQLYEGS